MSICMLVLAVLLMAGISNVQAMENNVRRVPGLGLVRPITTITLPDSSKLEKRLCKMNLHHFLEKTKLHQQLGGQTKAPLGVIMAVELALYDYAKNLGSPMIAAMMQMQKPNIIRAISEEAFYEAERNGLIK